MEFASKIDIKEPDLTGLLFQPFVKFQLKQLNMTPECMTDDEIDYQANQLINEVEKLRKTAKRQLKAAKTRHDKIISNKMDL